MSNFSISSIVQCPVWVCARICFLPLEHDLCFGHEKFYGQNTDMRTDIFVCWNKNSFYLWFLQNMCSQSSDHHVCSSSFQFWWKIFFVTTKRLNVFLANKKNVKAIFDIHMFRYHQLFDYNKCEIRTNWNAIDYSQPSIKIKSCIQLCRQIINIIATNNSHHFISII